MAIGNAKVYWAARDFSVGLGNHHFILIKLCGGASTLKFPAETHKGQKFVTLGGFAGGLGKPMHMEANNRDDVAAVKEMLDPSRVKWYRSDWDTEAHRVRPPGGGDLAFAQTVARVADNFRKKQGKVTYNLLDRNCATWVNTLFKVAGVPRSARVRAGEFSGIDWGEEALLPASAFL